MLYTTYFSKLKSIPKNAKKLIITRFPPKWIDVDKLNNAFIVKELSPSPSILLNYKKDNDWGKYVEHFEKEMNEREDLKSMLSQLEEFLKKNNDVYLICYEKDYTKCHRYLIAKYLENKGIPWKELHELDNSHEFNLLNELKGET